MEEQTTPTEGGQGVDFDGFKGEVSQKFDNLSENLNQIKESLTPKEEPEEDYSTISDDDYNAVKKRIDADYGLSNVTQQVQLLHAVNTAPTYADEIAKMAGEGTKSVAEQLLREVAVQNPGLFQNALDAKSKEYIADIVAGRYARTPKTAQDTQDGEVRSGLKSTVHNEITKEFEKTYGRKPTDEEVARYAKHYGDINA